MKVLALDYGKKRIGIALGETESGIAFPRPFLENSKTILSELLKIKETEHIELFGSPFLLDASISDMQEEVFFFKTRVQEFLEKMNCSVSILFCDERFSTSLAYQNMRGMKQKNKKIWKDSLSAQVILENFFLSSEVRKGENRHHDSHNESSNGESHHNNNKRF
jgi:putative Holliday junction resolvase